MVRRGRCAVKHTLRVMVRTRIENLLDDPRYGRHFRAGCRLELDCVNLSTTDIPKVHDALQAAFPAEEVVWFVGTTKTRYVQWDPDAVRPKAGP